MAMQDGAQQGDDEAPVMAPLDRHVAYSFRHKASDSPDGEATGEEEDQATDDEPGNSSPWLSTLASVALFFVGVGLLAVSLFGFDNPFARSTSWGIVGIAGAPVLFLCLALPATSVLHGMARTMAGAMTIFAAGLAVVGLLLNGVLSREVALAFFSRIPSPLLAASAAFVFAASLIMLAREKQGKWIAGSICVACACLVPLMPRERLLEPAGAAAAVAENGTALADGLELPDEWALVERIPATEEMTGKLVYRHRIAPLEATVESPLGADRQARAKPQLVKKVGERLKDDLRDRPGTFACMLAPVENKPHQMKLVSYGNETTAVLIVQTLGGVRTLSVHGKRDVFQRYEDRVQRLFAMQN
jgi:hypothetical protein